LGLSMFLSLLLFLSTPAWAQEPVDSAGKFSILGQGTPAPYEGVLFDVNATASLLTLSDYYKQQCQIQMDFTVGSLQAEHDLEIKNLNIRLDSLQHEYTQTILQKDNEIATLQDVVKKNSRKNPWLWAVIGGVVGAGATVAIVETVRD